MVWSVAINTSIRIFSLHGKDEGCKQEGRMDTKKHGSKKDDRLR
jgi:hypothetical protein